MRKSGSVNYFVTLNEKKNIKSFRIIVQIKANEKFSKPKIFVHKIFAFMAFLSLKSRSLKLACYT